MTPTKVHMTRTAALNAFISGVKLEDEGSSAKALPILSQPLLRQNPLSKYVQYYKGLAELSLGRTADARRTFQALTADAPVGYLNEAASLREAESSEGLGDQVAALAIYERLSQTKTTAPDDVLMRMARAAEAAGDPEKALRTYSLVYYEFPFSDLSPAASLALDRFPNRPPLAPGTNRFKLELGRAEQLFGGRRYTQAREAFADLKGVAQGDDLELVNLRIAESDYFLKRLRPRGTVFSRTSKKRHARAKRCSSMRSPSTTSASATSTLTSCAAWPTSFRPKPGRKKRSTTSPPTTSSATTTRRRTRRSARCSRGFRRDATPSARPGRLAGRRTGSRQYAETIRVFERGAANFPRSDYRPAWLYWSARAYEALGEAERARARHTLSATDYYNSYYGRLSRTRMRAPLPQSSGC